MGLLSKRFNSVNLGQKLIFIMYRNHIWYCEFDISYCEKRKKVKPMRDQVVNITGNSGHETGWQVKKRSRNNAKWESVHFRVFRLVRVRCDLLREGGAGVQDRWRRREVLQVMEEEEGGGGGRRGVWRRHRTDVTMIHVNLTSISQKSQTDFPPNTS